MSQLKIAFVINPGSGGRRKNRTRQQAIDRMAELFPDAPRKLSTSAEEATLFTRQMLESGCECIGVMGGDGTFNSALQGFFSDMNGTPVRKGACMAIIPVGTGGDFRRSMGLENDPVAALALLTGDSTRPCDVGIVDYTDFSGQRRKRYFLNIVSFGLGGLVDKYVLESSKKLGGKLTFYISTLRAFKNYRNAEVEVVLDGREKHRLTSVLVAVANGRFFGSGMEIAPMAKLGDGLFEAILLGDLHLMDFIRHSGKIYGGRVLEYQGAIHRSCRKMEILPLRDNQSMYMDMDGEPLGTIPASVEIIPSALNLKI